MKLESYLQYIQESINETGYVYHLVQGKESEVKSTLRKYGFCSPRRLYEVNRELFRKTTYRIYKKRTSDIFNIPLEEVTDEDILKYLDTAKHRVPYFSSRSLFFNFINSQYIHKSTLSRIKPFVEISVPINVLKKYKPIIVGPGKVERYGTWEEIQNPDFIDIAKKQAKKDITYNFKLAFAHLVHLAVDAYHIPFNKINIIRVIK